MENGLIVFFVTEGESYGAAIWQIPELHGKLNSPHLDELPPLMRMLILLWKPGCNLRSQLANAIERAHIHNANYDVKKKNMLVTAEDESGIHIWDLRKHKFPVKELPGHTWIWVVTCNPEYNGLILSLLRSAGTDSTVNLWLAPASAGDESTSESIAESPTQQADPLLNSYGDYEDSIYGLAWSSREPWIFASLSYDGRVVIESIRPFLSRK